MTSVDGSRPDAAPTPPPPPPRGVAGVLVWVGSGCVVGGCW